MHDVIRAIDGFRSDHAFASATKIVLFAPPGLEESDDAIAIAQLELLQELQRAYVFLVLPR
jgi:hypothetical protein